MYFCVYIYKMQTRIRHTQRFQCAQKVINLITKDCFMLSLVRTFPGITLIRLDWIVVLDRRLHSIKQLMTSNEEVFIVLPLISIKLSSFECTFFFSYSCVCTGFFPLISFYSANIMCLLWICFRFDLTIVQHTGSSSPFTQKNVTATAHFFQLHIVHTIILPAKTKHNKNHMCWVSI